MKVHPVTGLVPCEILVSEAGLGLRAGEVRGLSPEIAKKMIAAGAASAIDPVFDPATDVAPESPEPKTGRRAKTADANA